MSCSKRLLDLFGGEEGNYNPLLHLSARTSTVVVFQVRYALWSKDCLVLLLLQSYKFTVHSIFIIGKIF